jgi:predicted metal-dependent phosphoesterase TrpH
VIDLHLHTSASDGTLRPADLVARAARAGLVTISVTDHDTTAGLDDARAEAVTRGMRLIDGIEITAVEDGRDVHVLGYFVDPHHEPLRSFLEKQLSDRLRRVREIADRLAALGAPIDPKPLMARGLEAGKSVGRPHVASALIASGHVQSWDEAFDKYLEKGKPAFVPRRGATAAEVIGVIRAAGGVASLAHPGLTAVDTLVPHLADAGLAALEVRHSEQDETTESRYREMAHALGLATTGGSDFHGDHGERSTAFGTAMMIEDELAALESRR